MCQQPVANKQAASARRGKCQWLTPNPAQSMRGVGATLEITANTKSGPVTRAYFVSNIIESGRLVGWTLTQPMVDGENVVQYTIDASFDLHDAAQWDCTCKDHVWHSKRRKVHNCKHVCGVAAGLVHIGLLPASVLENLN